MGKDEHLLVQATVVSSESTKGGTIPTLTEGAVEKMEEVTGLELGLVVVMCLVSHANKIMVLMGQK